MRWPTGSRRSSRILNHGNEPVELDGPDRCRQRLRRSVRGQGRAGEEGQVRARVVDGSLVLKYQRETYRPRDLDHVHRSGCRRRERPVLHHHRAAAWRVEHRAERRGLRRRARRAAGRPGRDPRPEGSGECAGTWRADWRSGLAVRPGLSATGIRLKLIYRRCLTDLAALGSRRWPCPAGRCRQRACPGS